MNKNINIQLFGNPYDKQTFKFLLIDDIIEYYLYWGKDIVNHIDGSYSLIIDDKSINTKFIITDYYGYYPLFYNKKTLNVLSYLPKGIVNNNIIDGISSSNIKNLDHISKTIDIKYFKNFLQDANKTLYYEYNLFPPRSITEIKNNKIKHLNHYQVTCDQNRVSDLKTIFKYFEHMISSFLDINDYEKYTIVHPITVGYDSRNIYYMLKNLGLKNVVPYCYHEEESLLVKQEYNDDNIYYINTPKDINFLSELFKKHILDLDGMSNLSLLYSQFYLIDNILNDKCLYITADGANTFIFSDDFYKLSYTYINNSGPGHLIKNYSNTTCYFPIFLNKKFLSLTQNFERKDIMNYISNKLCHKKITYYDLISNTKYFKHLFYDYNFDSKLFYIKEFMKRNNRKEYNI